MKGFTLIEMLIVLAIAGILCLIGIPSFNSLKNSIYADAAISQLCRAIELTRSEAIKTNSIATLCPSADGYQCGKNWSKGYIVFIDHEENGQVDSDDQIIHFFKPVKGEGSMTWKNFRGFDYLQMTPLGNTNAQNGTFTYYSADKKIKKTLVVSLSGRIRSEIISQTT